MKTSPRQPSRSGREKSMFSQADFPVSPSAMQEAEKERKMTATSGLKCYERFGRYSPLGSLLKTLLASRRWYNPAVSLKWDVQTFSSKKVLYVEKNTGTSSMPSVKTLSEKDMKSNRLLFQLVPQERPIEENRIWIVAHRTDTGLETLQQEGQDGVSAPAPPPYAYSCGGDQVHHQAQFQEPDGNGTDSPCHERQAAITEESSRGNRGFTGFPSVQPTICRGDDGLPFDVDDLAISEGKWRKESIKAYGNAWVPQVALEIFKAIEEYNNN